MADERLRLVAEVTDQFTGPLSKMETALRRTGATGRQTAADMRKDFEGFHGVLGKTQGALQGFTPLLGSMGAASGGAALGIGAITAALRSFSSGTQALTIMSRETGLAADQIRAFGALGERFGVSAETMGNGVRGLADNMSQLRKRYGDTYSSLQAMNLGDLVEKLVAAPNMKAALDAAMEALSNIGDPIIRRKVAEKMFGVSELGAVAGMVQGRYKQMMDEILRTQGVTTQAVEESAQKFEGTLSRLNARWEKFKLETLGPLLGGLNTAIEKDEEIGDQTGRAVTGFKRRLGIGLSPKEALEDKQTFLKRRVEMLDETPNAPDYVRKRDRMTDELKRVGDELEKLRTQGGATVQQQSYGGATTGGGLIHKASFGGVGGFTGGPGLGGFGGPMPTLGGGYGGGGGGYAGSGGRGGGSLDAPGSRTAPRGGAPAGLPPLPGMPSGPLGNGSGIEANPGAYKDVLDHIARSEGTANRAGGGYNTSLGYGRYLPGGREQNLTSQTLDQISALGNHMRRQPGNPNSSALGRYQIVGQTMRRLMRKMGLRGDELFDEKMQDRMGAELARGRGASAVGLGQEWASLRGQRLARAVELMRNVDPKASTMPGDRVASAGSGGPGPEPQTDMAGSGERPGDQMMRRFYGDAAPAAKGGPTGGAKGSLHIQFENAPAGMRPRASMDDLFKDVTVSKSRQMDMTSV